VSIPIRITILQVDLDDDIAIFFLGSLRGRV